MINPEPVYRLSIWGIELTLSDILLIAGSLLVFILFIFALRIAIKAAFVSKWSGSLLVVLGVLFIAYLFFNLHKIGPEDWAQIVLVLGLVAVTGLYALYSAGQAKASVKMAEGVKEQTKILKETVSLSIRPSFDMTITAVKGGVSYEFEPPDEFTIRIENIGKGPARGLFIFCRGDGILYSEKSLRNLNQGEHKEFSIQRQTSLDQRPKVKQLLLTIIYLNELGDTLESSMPINYDGKNWEPGAITMIIEENQND